MTDPKPRRRPMTIARKRRIHGGQAGPDGVTYCGCGCGAVVPLEGSGVIYEHVIDFWTCPELDDDGPNVQAWTTACAHRKTNAKGGDKTKIAKTKRQHRKHGPGRAAELEALAASGGLAPKIHSQSTRKGANPLSGGGKLKGRPFAKRPSQKIQSRGFGPGKPRRVK